MGGRGFAAGERRIEIARAGGLHDFRGLARGLRRDGRVRGDEVARAQRRRQRADGFQERGVVGNKNLDEIAKVGDLDRGADKIWLRMRRPAPDINLKPGPAQGRRDATADDAETDDADFRPGRLARHKK